MALEQVSTFVLPNEYQRQATEARRRRRMAEMLAQQAYQPSDISAPIPTAAPLVQGLQAFLAARAERKADEAEEAATKAGTQEARDFLRALTEPEKKLDVGQAAVESIKQMGTPELVDGRLEYRKTAMPAPTPEMIPQAGPQVRLGRKPEDDQIYMPTATGRETDPQRIAALLANPQMKAGFTDEQRRSLALEGMLTSQNPMLQKVAGAIYPTLQPEKPKLQTAAVNLKDLTPESAKRFAASGDPKDIEYAVEPAEKAKPTNLALLLSEMENLPPDSPLRPMYQSAIAKETRVPGTTVINTGGRNEPLERIIGPDGKPVLVPRSQAVGKTPAPAPTATTKMPGSVRLEIDERKRAAKQYDFGLQRAEYFRKLINDNSLPLSVMSGAQYALERATDPSGTARGPKGEKPAYVLYGELQRFVTQQVNTILQMAKGTQTEGDALRAQQQILDNPNNSAVVLSALEDLERIFKEARQIAIESAESLAEGYETPAASSPVEVDY